MLCTAGLPGSISNWPGTRGTAMIKVSRKVSRIADMTRWSGLPQYGSVSPARGLTGRVRMGRSGRRARREFCAGRPEEFAWSDEDAETGIDTDADAGAPSRPVLS